MSILDPKLVYFSKILQASKIDGIVEKTGSNTVLSSTEHSDKKFYRPDGIISVAIQYSVDHLMFQLCTHTKCT